MLSGHSLALFRGLLAQLVPVTPTLVQYYNEVRICLNKLLLDTAAFSNVLVSKKFVGLASRPALTCIKSVASGNYGEWLPSVGEC